MKKWRMTGLFLPALAVLVTAFAGCESPKTFAPDVEMTMGIPLLAENMVIGNEILKADSVRVNPKDSTQMQIYFAKDNLHLRNDGYIGQDRLDILQQERQTSSYEVGLIQVDDVPPEGSGEIMLTEVVPGLSSIPPGSGTVPFAGTTLPLRKDTASFRTFRSATFSDVSVVGLNRLRMSFANRSPFLMENVTIYLSTTGATNPDGTPVEDDLLIAPVVFPSVTAGDSLTSDPIALANVSVPGVFYTMFELDVATGNIPSDEIPDSYVRVVTDLTALEVTDAETQLPSQRFVKTREIGFASTDLDLYRVILADQGLSYVNVYEFNISNTLPTTVQVHYQLPNFLHIPKAPEGDVWSLVPDNTDNYSAGAISAGPDQTLQIRFLLDGARFESTTSFALDKLTITFEVDVQSSGDEFVQVNENDGVELESFISQLAIERVEGRVPDGKPIEVQIEPFEMNVEEASLPAGLSGLQATNIDVAMDIATAGFTATMYADLNMRVYNTETMQLAAFYEREISEDIGLSSVMSYRLTKDSTGAQNNSPLDIINATLDNMFGSGSSTIELEGLVSVTGTVTLIRDTSRIHIPEISVTSPMKFQVPPAMTFDAKSETDDGFNPGLSESVKNDFIPRTVRATLFGELTNYFPSGGTLVMFASPDPLFTRLRSEYPAENQDDLLTIPDVIPANVPYGDEFTATQVGAVFKLFTVELPIPTLLPNGTVDPDNPGVLDTPLQVVLDDELALFEYENLYLLPRIQLVQDGTTEIALGANDRLELSLMMFLTARTNVVEDTP